MKVESLIICSLYIQEWQIRPCKNEGLVVWDWQKKKKKKNTWKTLGQLIAYYGKFRDLLLDSFV